MSTEKSRSFVCRFNGTSLVFILIRKKQFENEAVKAMNS